MEGSTEDPLGGSEGETRRGKGRWKVRDLLADERRVRPMLDFLCTTDVGRLAPPLEEEDAVSAVSEQEVREWLEEHGAGAEEPDGEGTPLFLPTPEFMASAGTAWEARGALSFVILLCFSHSLLSPLSFPWCASQLLGTGLGGGQRGACNVPPLRGLRTGKRTVNTLAMISLGRMRVMNKNPP